jgi:hypothetical protein
MIIDTEKMRAEIAERVELQQMWWLEASIPAVVTWRAIQHGMNEYDKATRTIGEIEKLATSLEAQPK